MTPDIHHHASLPSTMDEARRLALAGAPEFTAVQADEQTSGRGRFGNQWVSPPGNLYMTTILRPRVPVRHVAQMSFAVALALADTIDRDDVRLKWPNDVLAGGRKIAGILLEMQSGRNEWPDFLLVGTGVNIAAGPPGSAFLAATQPHRDVGAVRDDFLRHLARWYGQWLEAGFTGIRAAWLARAHGMGESVTARLANRSYTGVFDGIDAAGNLQLREPGGGVRSITSGDVHFAPKAAPG